MHSSLCVFSLLVKPSFFKLDSFLIDSYLSTVWNYFLDKSYCIFDPSSFLDFVSIASQSIKKLFCLADRFSTKSWSIKELLPSTDSWQNLDRFIFVEIQCSTDPWSIEMEFLFKGYCEIRFHFSLFSLDRNYFLSLQTLSSHSNLHFLQDFGLIKLQSYGKNSLSLSFHAFHTLDLGFGVFFENFGVFENFWDFCESFGLGVVYLMLYVMHFIPLAFSECFMHLDVCLIVENCVLLGLDWVEPMMQLFLARHMFMHSFHAYPFFSIYLF